MELMNSSQMAEKINQQQAKQCKLSNYLLTAYRLYCYGSYSSQLYRHNLPPVFRITEWLGWEETLKIIQFWTLCCDGLHQPDLVTQARETAASCSARLWLHGVSPFSFQLALVWHFLLLPSAPSNFFLDCHFDSPGKSTIQNIFRIRRKGKKKEKAHVSKKAIDTKFVLLDCCGVFSLLRTFLPHSAH